MKPSTLISSLSILLLSLLLALYLRPPTTPTTPFSKDVRLGSGLFFDTIAYNYDTLNKVISLGLDNHWRREAVKALNVTSNAENRILDVATGTGDVAIVAAGMLGDSVKVVGVDPSREMVEVGIRKVRRKGLEGVVKLEVGTVENLRGMWDGEGDLFDGVVVAFGVRNFEDREKGLREMGRVVKKGRKVVVLEAVTADQKGFWMWASRLFSQNVMPVVAGIVGGKVEAYKYLADSMGRFPNVAEFQKLIGRAGLELKSYRRLPPFGVGPMLYVMTRQE